MKASVKLRDPDGLVQKQPIVKAKLPFDLLGFPVHAAFKVCGHIEELALRFSSAHQAAGPSMEVSYRPHQQDRPFTLSLRTGFSPWPSSPASAFTITAEFNLSRPSNPTFLLRVKPQLGDFSFRHDFRSQICGGNGSSGAFASKNGDHRHAIDVSASGLSFTNAFARYASKLHLSDNAVSPRHDSAKSFEPAQNLRYNAAGNPNLASFDSTPYASERASLPRFDLTNLSLEHPSQIFMEEKRSFQDVSQHASIRTDWVPLRDNTSCQKAASTHQMSRMDEEWERVGDAISRSTTSASSSTQQNRDSDHTHVRRHAGMSRSTSSLAGWSAGGFSGCTHLWACTRLPISPEAHLKIRWSVSAYSNSSTKVPFLPLLLLDKVSLEATTTPCTGIQKTPTVLPFSNMPKNEMHTENVKQARASSCKKAREESISDGSPDITGLESELKSVQQVHTNNVNTRKNSIFGQFLQVSGLHG